LRAQRDELEAQLAGLYSIDRVRRQILENQLSTVRSKQSRVNEQQRDQLLVAQSAGTFIVEGKLALIGRYLRQGEVAAYVVPPVARTIRVAVEQADVGNLAAGVERIELRFAESLETGAPVATTILRQTPKADVLVASPALTTVGGGDLLADPTDATGRTVLEPVFDIELAWPVEAPGTQVGGHVHVKFVHPPASLSQRLIVATRRVFLGRFDV
jgi:putative peptide zinc metalloprotease protein